MEIFSECTNASVRCCCLTGRDDNSGVIIDFLVGSLCSLGIMTQPRCSGGVKQLFDEHRLLFVCAKKAHQSTMVHFRKASPGMLCSLDWESQLGQKN